MSEPSPSPVSGVPASSEGQRQAAERGIRPAPAVRGAAFPPPPPEEVEPYKSLSLLAIAGFVLAAFWAVCILVGMLGAFRAPLALPGWSLLIGSAAAGVTLFAAVQVFLARPPSDDSGAPPRSSPLALLGLLFSAVGVLLLLALLVINLVSRTPSGLSALVLLPPVAGACLTLAAALQARRRPREGEAGTAFWGWAVAGFVLTVLWALGASAGRIGAMFYESPVLLPAWCLVFPVAGAALSFAARAQIKRSEGTLAGLSLTGWGLGLSVVLGLCYWAYYIGIYVAVRQQSDDFARDWVNRLKNGDVEAAYVLTLAPSVQRDLLKGGQAGDKALRRELEERFNLVEQGVEAPRGPFSQFALDPRVRYLSQAGPSAKVESLGSADSEYVDKGYLVFQNYRVTTDEVVMDLRVGVHGRRGQWQVRWDKSGILRDQVTGAEKMDLTEGRGRRMRALRDGSFLFASAWAFKLGNHQLQDEAVRDTLAPGQPPPAGAGFFFQLARRLYLSSLAQVRADEFYATEDLRKTAPEEVRRLFLLTAGPQGVPAFPLQIDRNAVAVCKREGDRLRFEHDCLLPLGKVVIEGVVTTETDASALDSDKAPEWRVVGLRLTRAREVANPEQMGRGPRRDLP